MTITVLATGGTIASVASTVSLALPLGTGANRVAVVWAGCANQSGRTISSATLGGGAVSPEAIMQFNAGTRPAYPFLLPLTLTGSQTFVANWAGGTGNMFLVYAILQGDNELTFGGPVPSASVWTTNPLSIDITDSAVGDLIACLIQENNGRALAPGAGDSLLGAFTGAASTFRNGLRTDGAVGTVNISGTFSGGTSNAMAFAVAVKEASGATAPVISSFTPASTSIAVAWTGTATHYRINGGAATALPDGTSPDTITGLTANTEYNTPGLELGAGVSGPWSTPVAFGTTNPGSGGSGIPLPTIVSAAVGSAAASGLTARIGLGTTIAGGVGTVAASGLQAIIVVNTTISAGVGAAAAGGLQATINLGSGITISGQVGAADASGLPVSISIRTTITCGIGEAQASGLQATIGAASAIVISCGVGAADALGLRAIIRADGAMPAYLAQPTTGASWSYRQTATLWRLVATDAWGGQTTHELAGLFLCDYAIDDKQANTARGSEYVTRLMIYTSLPGVQRGDMVKIGATNEADPYRAGAHEVLESTAFADTFRAEGAPDFRIVT